jgi:hypothetical protein
MYLAVFLILVLLLILVILLSVYPLRVAGAFNSGQQPDFNLMFSWLNPFIKGFITRHGNQITLTINLFSRKLLVKSYLTENDTLKLKGRNYRDYINIFKALEISNAKLYSSYGFLNPATTGVLCGTINLISQYINLDEFYNNADFFADHSYFNISAETDVNVLVSITRILTRKLHFPNIKALAGNR